ncbi:MAG: glycosyltransferase family 4 protein [Rhizobacter sp.]|nr:glycosyltransferase family 4 protein [Ferruginibacter sp.]
MTYKAAIKKLRLESIGMAPFVWLGKLTAILYPLKTRHSIFLFFPNADIGGSPRVNAELTQLLKDKHPIIIFSKKAHNNQYRKRFEAEGVKILDIHKWIDNKAFHFINFFFRGLLAGWINQQPTTIVFGGESIFFYKVIPHIKKDIPCIELNHVNKWLPYTIGFIDRMDARIFSTRAILKDVEEQYRKNNLPEYYFKKLHFIDNAIDIPESSPVNNELLQVFYIGRGSPQKRVPLIVAIAQKMHAKNLPVQFNFIGDVEKVIDVNIYPYCKFYGNINDDGLMHQLYQQADILILTSAFEGLPVVIMQMMGYGKVVVSTAVSGIPDYIFHEQNGMLIFATDEKQIISEGAEKIERLLNEPGLRQRLGMQAKKDAIATFGRKAFEDNYLTIFGFNRKGAKTLNPFI